MSGRAERKGDTESEAGSRLRAVSAEPDTGLQPKNREIVTRAEVGHPWSNFFRGCILFRVWMPTMGGNITASGTGRKHARPQIPV